MNIYENTSSSARYENLPALPTATGQEVVYCYGVHPPCLLDAICRSLGRPSFLETLYFGVVPAFVTLTFVIEIIIDFLQAIMPRQSSFTATVVKCVTYWAISSVAIAAVVCSFPAPLAKELLIVSSFITLLVRYYIARMRHLRASVWLMLSPLAVITLPYVLYALFCKESLPDHLTNQ